MNSDESYAEKRMGQLMKELEAAREHPIIDHLISPVLTIIADESWGYTGDKMMNGIAREHNDSIDRIYRELSKLLTHCTTPGAHHSDPERDECMDDHECTCGEPDSHKVEPEYNG